MASNVRSPVAISADSECHAGALDPVRRGTLSVCESIATVRAPAWKTRACARARSMMFTASGVGTSTPPALVEPSCAARSSASAPSQLWENMPRMSRPMLRLSPSLPRVSPARLAHWRMLSLRSSSTGSRGSIERRPASGDPAVPSPRPAPLSRSLSSPPWSVSSTSRVCRRSLRSSRSRS
jgi:hypothetical protein